MGIERTVTLWYLHRQTLLQELALLQAQLQQTDPASSSEAGSPGASIETLEIDRVPTVPLPADRAEIEQQYKSVQQKLRDLGPCPKAMMG